MLQAKSTGPFLQRHSLKGATAYVAALPTIVSYHAPNIFVHTSLVSKHHVIEYALLKTRGKQEQKPLLE